MNHIIELSGRAVETIISGPADGQMESIAKSPSLELIKHLRPDFSSATKSFPELLPHATFVVSDGSELTYAICMAEKIANDEGKNDGSLKAFFATAEAPITHELRG